MNAYIKGGIVSVVILLAAYAWYRANYAELAVNRSPEKFQLIDQMEKEGVPDFTLQTLEGKSVSLSEFKDQIVVVNFWASWCNPCVEEFPSMLKLVEKFNGKVVVIAVSTDDQKEDIETFTKAFGLPKPHFEVVWDQEKTVMAQYGIDKIPESFLVGPNRKLIRKVLGIENWSSPDAIAYFETLIANNSSSTPTSSPEP